MALDIGGRRIGVALANAVARLPQPLTAVEVGESVFQELERLIKDHEVGHIVVGLPRNLRSEDTAQTTEVRNFVDKLKTHLPTDVTLSWQDEALTSRLAEKELQARGKPFAKGDVDALAATYILEDYLNTNPSEVMP